MVCTECKDVAIRMLVTEVIKHVFHGQIQCISPRHTSIASSAEDSCQTPTIALAMRISIMTEGSMKISK